MQILSRYSVSQVRTIGFTLLARLMHKRCRGYANIRANIEGRTGLEIGGPSSIFARGGLISVYDFVSSVDQCNYAGNTLWTSAANKIRDRLSSGGQFVCEASDLSGIADESYDFVLASHVLEHVANPLRALTEWRRVLRPGGMMVVIVPDKSSTFDHNRPYTTFEHLQTDFEANISEADMSHLDEILALHDLDLDPPAGSAEEFRIRCLENKSNRAMHHHVFSAQLLAHTFDCLRMNLVNISVEPPYHIVVHARKGDPCDDCDPLSATSRFLDLAATRKRSNPSRSFESSRLLDNTFSQYCCDIRQGVWTR